MRLNEANRAVVAHYGAGVVQELCRLGYDMTMLHGAKRRCLSGSELVDLAHSHAAEAVREDLTRMGRKAIALATGAKRGPTLWEHLCLDEDPCP
jgi:hypothetical protein